VGWLLAGERADPAGPVLTTHGVTQMLTLFAGFVTLLLLAAVAAGCWGLRKIEVWLTNDR
jgi:hypothetical protein